MSTKKKTWVVIVIYAVCAVLIATAATSLAMLLPHRPSHEAPTGDVPTHTVTFYSNDGTVLKTEQVADGTPAAPPVTPVMAPGSIFTSWATDFSDVTDNLEVHPVCEETVGKPNVIAAQSVYTKQGETVFVPIQLCGDVCVAGLDLVIRYDAQALSLDSVTEDGGVVYNADTPGVIRLNYVSAKNTEADVDVCGLRFLVNAETGEQPLTIEVADVYAFEEDGDRLYVPDYTVIGGRVFAV